MSTLVERVARAILEVDTFTEIDRMEDAPYLVLARAAIAEIAKDVDSIEAYAGDGKSRYWSSVGAWIYPGQAIAIVNAEIHGRAGSPIVSNPTTRQEKSNA